MTKAEYEKLVDEQLSKYKKQLMTEFESDDLNGWEVGDIYFFSDCRGTIMTKTVEEDSDIDKFRITHGYAKLTKEEIEFQLERDAVIHELTRYEEPEDRPWDGEETKHWYFIYGHKTHSVCIDYLYSLQHHDFYFETKEDAEKALEAIGEERIKKYFLRIKDEEASV